MGLRFYRARYRENREGRGAETSWPVGRKPLNCADARQLANVWRYKARTALFALERWQREMRDEWNYQRFMPAWMIRLGQCEMSLDWHRRWGIYEGAFAFATSTWDSYKLPGYPASAADATPRQQMMVVLRIARELTVGVPWGCWRGPQHAWVRGGLPEHGFHG